LRRASKGSPNMRSYDTRLAALEEAIAPKPEPLCCTVFGDANADGAVAKFRVARNWPDDDAHPVIVLRLRWVTPEDLKVI
jgi:hypothetical protein